MIVWPDRVQVENALRDWVGREAKAHPELDRLGYFGSYARDDWGVGSDLDLIAIVARSTEPFERRALSWNLEELPVPADLLIYTGAEWERMQAQKNFFALRVAREVKWVYP